MVMGGCVGVWECVITFRSWDRPLRVKKFQENPGFVNTLDFLGIS